jgi:hypothetical protein
MANDADQSSAAGAARVEVHLPVEALRGYVTFYYFVTARGPLTDFLYPEWGNVRFELAGGSPPAAGGSPASA